MQTCAIVAASILTVAIPIAVSAQQGGISPLDRSDQEGTLELIFVTAWGDSIMDGSSVSVQKLVSGRPVAEWTGERVMKLKYGTYHVKAQHPGFYLVERDINIEQPYQVSSICFFTAPLESPWEGNLIRGHISERSARRDCRLVRFISPFADGVAVETKASQTGDFGLENVRPGTYFVITLGAHGICETSEVVILFGERVKDLSIAWADHAKK
jgi:hypothetical protein